MHRELTPELIEEIAARFRAIGDPARVSLMGCLRDGEHTVGELGALCGMAQPSVTKHLQQLSANGFVKRRRDGQFVRYRLADRAAFRLCDLMCARVGAERAVAGTERKRAPRS